MGSVDSDIPGPFDVKSVAIIGAGPSGLAAAKYLLEQPPADPDSSSSSYSHFTRITIFEQQPQVGGVWLYSPTPVAGGTPIPQTSAHPSADDEPLTNPLDNHGRPPIFPSPMYERLHTNIPHTLMQYGDIPFRDDQGRTVGEDEGADLRIFPERQVVQRYLEKYARDVWHLIRFSTSVLNVKLLRPEVDASSNFAGRDDDGNGAKKKKTKDQWEVTSKNLLGSEHTETYDAVVVASGHYRTTYVPDIEGIKAFHKKYPGTISHSKTYRTPEAFRDKKVLLVGNSASGLDIASQIAKVCAGPLLVSVRTKTPEEVRKHVGFEEVAEIEQFLVDDDDERSVILKDGRQITNLDAVLFCTGYLYTFPFFNSKDLSKDGPQIRELSLQPFEHYFRSPGPSPSSFKQPDFIPKEDNDGDKDGDSDEHRPLITDGRKVHGLYKDLLHIRHPTLAFPGLPIKVIPFPFAEAQAAVFARVWANELRLPSVAEMEAWEEREEREVRTPGKYHVYPALGDARYINEMHDWVSGKSEKGRGKEPPWWDEEMFWRRGVYAQAKMRFEQGGKKARTLEELGFVYQPDEKKKKEREDQGELWEEDDEFWEEARNDRPGLDVAA